MYDPLIYGKNQTTRIVNVEIENEKAVLFLEDKEGSVLTEEQPNRFWVLEAYSGSGNTKLQGELHYKYGKQFSNKFKRAEYLTSARKRGIDYFTIYDEKESFLTKDGYTLFKDMKHTEPSMLSFDIESTGLFHNKDSKVLLISNTFRKNGVITRKLFAYDEYENQGDMIVDWCNWVREVNPSIILGHNIYSFDLPYLNYVAEMHGEALCLGRNDSAMYINNKSSQFRVDGSRSQEYNRIRIYGREVIDTMFLAIKYDVASKKYDNYGLKNIIKQEGLEKSDRVMYDAGQIRFQYENPEEWTKIKAYCEHDADDSLALYDLMAPALFYLTQSVPKTLQGMLESATGSQINLMMVRSYLQEGHSIPKATKAKPFEGAISLGNAGIYRNVYKVDVASLYPSIILQCEVFDEDKDPKANFLKIIQTFTSERLKNKALAKTSKYHDDLQQAQKIVINSGYGFLGTEGLNFNSPEAAEFITKTGRDILQTALDWAATKNMKIVNADTDSISFCKIDESNISEEEQVQLLDDLNKQYPDKIRFEDDGFFPTVCVLKAKNYVLYDGKKIKYKGSAIKATQKEPALKEFIKVIIDSIINHKDDYREIYLRYVKEACNVQDIKRWASRKTISERTLNSERKNESRIKDAIEGTEIVEGDRIHVFYKDKETLELVQNFNGVYDLDKLLQKTYDTAWTFDSVLDCEALFPNFKLKRNKKLLEEIINAR